MSVCVLEAIADAIMRFEGWAPGSISYQNRNPGNLRASRFAIGTDRRGYCVFPCLVVGYSSLLEDLVGKLTGTDAHGLGPRSTLIQLFEVYAPAQDKNDPQRYAEFVASALNQVYQTHMITPATMCKHIFEIVGQEYPRGQCVA